MIIDGNTTIAEQLGATAPRRVTFPDGRGTQITPVCYVPQVSDAGMRLPLDGKWRVAVWPFSQSAAELAAPGVDDSGWESVVQPGKVFTQDVETPAASIPNWDRIGLAHIDAEDGAILRRSVRIPEKWAGKRIHLTFDSIYPAGRVYLDGKLLGEHNSGLTPVEYDVTDIVKPGEHALVAVRLLRKHPFVKMDMPRHAGEFAGLAQHAYFHATELVHISEHHLISSVDDSLRQGALSGTVSVRNLTAEWKSARVILGLVDGPMVAVETTVVDIAPNATVALPTSMLVDRPRPWNDEYPNLYGVAITLEVDGLPTQTVKYRTGFRRFELKEGRATLNGNPVKFRGVNHLTYHPEYGMYTPEDWLRQNLALMKKANINCIRTHYLGPRGLADLCDEMGIYLIQELPIDWGTDYIADPEWLGPALMRIQGGVLRDRRHPSVMVWSVGNENMPAKHAEAEDGYNHLRIYDRFVKTLDPSRPTMFPPPGPANKIAGILEVRLGDIADTHYSFSHIERFLETGVVENPIAWDGGFETTTREDALARGWSGVWFSSEYGIANLIPDLLNAPYGDIINDKPVDQDSTATSFEVFTERLRREWGTMRSEPSCLGGAYFPWICGAAGDNPWGWTVWAEDNDWGVVTADLLPKPFFWAMRVLFSPVWFPERVAWKAGQTSISFEVVNQYNTIDLADCKLRTMMAWAKNASTREWRDVPVACPPGARATVTIPIWSQQALESLTQGIITIVRVVLLDPKGFRPITHDIRVTPETVATDTTKELLIGPDVTF